MRKNFILIIIVLIIAPAIVNASWWNPLTWFQSKAELTLSQLTSQERDRTAELEKRIAELELELKKNQTISTPATSYKKTEPTKAAVGTTGNATQNTSRIEPAEIVTLTPAPVSEITVTKPFVTQSLFKGYGGYEIRIRVTANNDNVYIPMTTTDTTRGRTGFSYNINGGDFKGSQDSKVSCTSSKDNMPVVGNNYCFIPKGTSLEVSATVWLTPYQVGNYSLQFKKLGYFTEINHEMNYYNLNTESETLYLSF